MIRIGISGTGAIAPFHIKAFAAHHEATLTGICGRERSPRVEAMARDWGIRAFRDYDEMLESDEVDAVAILSVNELHREQVLKAIARGKPVLIEKPMVTRLSEFDEIVSASRKAGVLVFPGHNFAYRGAVREAKRLLDEGRLGRVMHSSFAGTHTLSEFHAAGWRGQGAESGGGALMDSGHHQVYQSIYLRGMPAEIQAFSSRLVYTGMDDEDIAQVNLRYADGSLGTIMQSWTSNHGGGIAGIRIFGDKGQLVLSDALYFNGEKLSTDVEYADSFVRQNAAFVDAVLGRSQPVSDLDDARDALRLILTAYKSAAEHTVERLGRV